MNLDIPTASIVAPTTSVVALQDAHPLQSIALVGAFLPRPNAVATFGTELGRALSSEFPSLDCLSVALHDATGSYAYPPTVQYAFHGDIAGYRRAATFLKSNAVDVVSLQYEHSLFEGEEGTNLLELLRDLPMPVVTTVHTLSLDRNERERQLLSEVISRSARVVALSSQAAESLRTQYQVSETKIDTIPHGAARPREGRHGKRALGFGDRFVLFTCGALGCANGMDALIDALPEIAQAIPNVLLVILGEPDLHSEAPPGESQRLALEGRVQSLRMGGHVVFFDRFVGQYELNDLMSAADVYVSPFREAELSTAAALATALAFGKVAVSTADPHARELLAQDRGVVLSSGKPRDIARAIIALCMDDVARRAMAARAASYGAALFWPGVARRYVDAFTRSLQDFLPRSGRVGK